MAFIKEEYQGTLINNFSEYKTFIANKHTKEWLISSEKEVYKVFGKPLKYR